jgi:tetrapyrrole methylase family protein/MazG family protein
MPRRDNASSLATVRIVGLGPAGASFVTREARKTIASSAHVFVRTARHPAARALLRKGAKSLDHCYEQSATMDEVYRAIADEVIEQANRYDDVVYAVPGSPFVLENSVALLRADPRVDCQFVTGMSFLDLCWARLGIDPVRAGVRLVDGEVFASSISEATAPMLIAQLWSKALLSEVKLAFEDAPEHAVLLHHLGLKDEQVIEVDFADLDRVITPDHLTCLYLPVAGESAASITTRLLEVVRVLREHCPWDASQTHQSLIRHLVEETYEAIEAIEALGEPPRLDAAAALEEELGDVLCQVLFHAAIASEEGLFSYADVAKGLLDKLVRRHPHVFGAPGELADAEQVLMDWERAKQVEKGRESIMDGIAPGLPALSLAEKVQRRAGRLFGDPERHGREVATLEQAVRDLAAGDLDATGTALLAIAALCAEAEIDGEEALRKKARELRDVVVGAERLARRDGLELADCSPERRRAYLTVSRGQLDERAVQPG